MKQVTLAHSQNRQIIMRENIILSSDSAAPMIYQIRIKGQLGQWWADWFGDVTIALAGDDDTLLTCSVIDQAALYGLLTKVRDLGMPLLAVNCVSAGLVHPLDREA